MKKKLYILLISVLGLSIQSCSDYLDSDYIFRDRETIEKVFTDRDKTEAWLANAFSYLSDACADVCNKRVTPHCLLFYKLTLIPIVIDFVNGYDSPLGSPISGSQVLKLDHVKRFVPTKNIRILLKCILLTIDLGSV